MNLRMKLRRRTRLFTCCRIRLPPGKPYRPVQVDCAVGERDPLLGKLVRVLFIALMFGVDFPWRGSTTIRQNGLLETLQNPCPTRSWRFCASAFPPETHGGIRLTSPAY